MKLQYKIIYLSIMLLYISVIGTTTVKAAQVIDEQSSTAVEQPAENRVPIMISIISYPTKLTYSKGESLDLTGLEVHAYYDDGTNDIITDYQVIGYDSNVISAQTVVVLYQNKMAVFTVNVLPEKVANISIADNGDSSYTLTWDAISGASRYEIYSLDDKKGQYVLTTYAYTNSITLSNPSGAVQSYRIKAIVNVMGVEYASDFSDIAITTATPAAVTDLSVTGTTATSISLTWTGVNGATGYMIYRSSAATDNFKLLQITSDVTYTNTGLVSGTGYKYKVCAYVFSEEYTGSFSTIIDVSTNPAKVLLKYKAGDRKVRLSWSAVTGATSYDIYIGSANSDFKLLTSISSGNGGTFIADNLITGDTYQFYIIAHRLYKGVIYDSQTSDIKTVLMSEILPTSSTAKLFPTEEDFYNSWTFGQLAFFSQYVDYAKSYVIPGLITTNVGGFSSTRMCPQGLTFAGDYLLMSAYDIAGEENSVIYVMGKSSKELLTTIILPGKPHVGGLTFDGSNIWFTNSSKVAAIRFSDIEQGVQSQEPYVFVEYNTVISLGYTTSFASYYDEKLWVGTYNELQSTNMYSYIIENKDSKPVLTKKDTILMPNRVQGIAFTNIGTLIISRSCQINSSMRGYLRQLDVYKPNFSEAVNGVIPLGNLVNSVTMPSMNEGIAIDGNYLYVTYETGAFEASKYKMDRITAFKLTDVVKKKKVQ